MKFTKIYVGVILSLFVTTSFSQEHARVDQSKYSMKMEQKQWRYIQGSIEQRIGSTKKVLHIIEKALKYGLAPAVPLGLLLAVVRCNYQFFIFMNDYGKKISKYLFLEKKVSASYLAICGGAFAMTAGLYVLIDRIFAIIRDGEHRDVLKSLLIEWHRNSERVPESIRPLLKVLYHDALAGSLSNERVNATIAALLAMSSVALTE